ncbi:MAG: sulfide/dihydroorotate dehydrogenase-like FAD/NAD-binding protein [Verrucomicrobia bacterium]|nr:sulfide/dihydroorotate dehydrogenase-like FAD/NAD-binding protein [Verrucomicrobiota bacterium]
MQTQHTIISKRELAPAVKEYMVAAPVLAKKAKAGQFIILRIAEDGERVPLTIADADATAGTITLVVQEVGKTTTEMGRLNEGDAILNLIGPLGTPSHIEKLGTVCVIGGGIGIAPIYPIAKAMRDAGNRVISIIGARSKDLLFWEDKMRAVSDKLCVTTDDGSYGVKGFVSDELRRIMEEGVTLGSVTAIGPVPMMRAVAETTRARKVPTVVSLNPIMIDGTGMCGGCRVTVGGETKFTCVDGPEFDGHLVDFAELIQRQAYYRDLEQDAADHCRLAQEHPEAGPRKKTPSAG